VTRQCGCFTGKIAYSFLTLCWRKSSVTGSAVHGCLLQKFEASLGWLLLRSVMDAMSLDKDFLRGSPDFSCPTMFHPRFVLISHHPWSCTDSLTWQEIVLSWSLNRWLRLRPNAWWLEAEERFLLCRTLVQCNDRSLSLASAHARLWF
jgi:hypothetical protein